MKENIHYIKEIMQIKGISITELGNRLGVSQQAASKYLVHDIRISNAAKIAEALGVELPALFIKPQVHKEPSEIDMQKNIAVDCPKCHNKIEICIKVK